MYKSIIILKNLTIEKLLFLLMQPLAHDSTTLRTWKYTHTMKEYLSNKEYIVFEKSLAINCVNEIHNVRIVSCNIIDNVGNLFLHRLTGNSYQCDSRKDKNEHNIN